MVSRTELEKIFFSRVYAGKANYALYRSIFSWLVEAAQLTDNENVRVLNIYSSHDRSGEREDVYKKYFFTNASYQELNFSKDAFVDSSGQSYDNHHLPFSDGSFDVVITTKVILEHISNPQRFLNECYRVLKRGGHGFFIAPLIRRQHQVPYDFFRFTQFALERLLKNAGFLVDYIKPSNGAISSAAFMATFFVSGLPVPNLFKKLFYIFLKVVIDPLANWLDRYDVDRHIPIYFLIKANKA